ncbi:MAG: N-acetyltransferase family protein [Kofleriaceae bacterium]
MPIRATEEADFGVFTAITNDLIATTAIHFGYEPLGPNELRDVWSAQRDSFPWLTMTDDAGTILGYAKAGTWRERAAYQWTCETTIYLTAASRGQGHGRVLYTSLLDACVLRGFHSAIGGIALPNAASVRLHESLGFVAVGVVKAAGRKFERWHDVEFWQRLL